MKTRNLNIELVFTTAFGRCIFIAQEDAVETEMVQRI
jgi:hypothetical protein